MIDCEAPPDVTNLPAHDANAVRVEADLKAGAAIRLPQLGEGVSFRHIATQ